MRDCIIHCHFIFPILSKFSVHELSWKWLNNVIYWRYATFKVTLKSLVRSCKSEANFSIVWCTVVEISTCVLSVSISLYYISVWFQCHHDVYLLTYNHCMILVMQAFFHTKLLWMNEFAACLLNATNVNNLWVTQIRQTKYQNQVWSMDHFLISLFFICA